MVFICLIHILFLTCCLWPRNCEAVGDHIVPSQEADRVTRVFPSLHASTSKAHLPEDAQLLKNNTAIWEPMLKSWWAWGRHLTCKLYLEENGGKPSVRLSLHRIILDLENETVIGQQKNSEIWRPSCKSIKAMTDHVTSISGTWMVEGKNQPTEGVRYPLCAHR